MATTPHARKPIEIGMIVPSKDRSINKPMAAPPAVDNVPITAEAVPATAAIGSMARVLRFGMRSECPARRRASTGANAQKGGWPPLATAITTVRRGHSDVHG